MGKKFFWDFHDTQNEVKRPKSCLEIMTGCVCVCVCIKASEYSIFCISGITQMIKMKIGVCLNQTRPFLWYHFPSNLIHGLEFYDNLNFLNNICNRSSCPEFQAIELNSFL